MHVLLRTHSIQFLFLTRRTLYPYNFIQTQDIKQKISKEDIVTSVKPLKHLKTVKDFYQPDKRL